MNVVFGWILTGFVSGSLLGLFFHRDDFWGGYGSLRRRIVRLGHISQIALGMLNVLFGLTWPDVTVWSTQAASGCFMLGGVTMPGVCFLTGWRMGFRYLFVVPVAALILAVAFTLM